MRSSLANSLVPGWLVLAAALLVGGGVADVAAVQESEPVRVAVLISAKGSYRAAARALQTSLDAQGYESVILELPPSRDHAGRADVARELVATRATIIATGGQSATVFALQTIPEIPVLFFMIPNALDATILSSASDHTDRLAGVTSDVDPVEQVDFILRVQPAVRRIAVLHSARSERTVAALRLAAGRRGLDVVSIDASKSAFPQAIEQLNRSGADAVLMIPDSRVYDSPTVQRLILWGVRQRRGVFTFSQNLTKAGALAGLYSRSDALGRQTAELVRRVASGEQAASIGLAYPTTAYKAINSRTAQLLNVAVDRTLVDVDLLEVEDK